MRRLWCLLRGHRVVRVVTGVEWTDQTLTGGGYLGKITEQHRRCSWCGKRGL